MPHISSLIKYFKGGSAEQEREIRGEVFVAPSNLNDLLSFDFHSNVILLGNKGVGKSIFVNVLHEAYLKNSELSLLITPNDLSCDPVLSKKTLSDRKSAAYGQILTQLQELSESTQMKTKSQFVAMSLRCKSSQLKTDTPNQI